MLIEQIIGTSKSKADIGTRAAGLAVGTVGQRSHETVGSRRSYRHSRRVFCLFLLRHFPTNECEISDFCL